MTLLVDRTAPGWAQQFATDVEAFVDRKLSEPRPLPEFTLSTLPPATDFRGCSVWVTDGSGSKLVVTSDGTDWRYQEGTAV